MANRGTVALDGCFHALAHPIRRGILERLEGGSATVGSVADAFHVAAPTISKHLSVLEDAGLVARKRVGREHYLTLRAAPLLDATSWLARYSRFWDERLDALEELVASLDESDAKQGSQERNS
jgi:DNA-binding transcriptional ArsR family regulator